MENCDNSYLYCTWLRTCVMTTWTTYCRYTHTSTYIYANIHKYGTSQLYHLVSVSTRFTLPRASGPWCVNRVETSNSLYNLYMEFLSVTKATLDS